MSCTFATEEVASIEAAVASLTLHAVDHQQPRVDVQPVAPPTPRAPKFEGPKIKANSSPEKYNAQMVYLPNCL